MNLTPLALAALYAYAKGQDQPDNNIPGAAPAATPVAESAPVVDKVVPAKTTATSSKVAPAKVAPAKKAPAKKAATIVKP